MKKSKHIQLVLITAALASCADKKKDWGDGSQSRTYLRSDSTAPYTRAHYGPGLWFYAFRPMGIFQNGAYAPAGYYSGALKPSSNVGSNAFKSGIVRGGFGRSGYTVSS